MASSREGDDANLKVDRVGSAAIQWSSLGFNYVRTRAYVRHTFAQSCWDGGEVHIDDGSNPHWPAITLPLMAGAFHYGQTLFEGIKAYHCADGAVRVFRPEDSARRMLNGCRRLMIPDVSTQLFMNSVARCVRENMAFVPPYGSGGSLYIRPFVFASGVKLGLGECPEYTFIVLVNPVGDYYSGGSLSPVRAMIIDDFDRAAPKGVGKVKIGGNYAADVLPSAIAKDQGFPIALYVDPLEHRYIEEFSTANFIAIQREGSKCTFVTPLSASVLDSITNATLQQLAKDMGMEIEQRRVAVEELVSFHEVGAVGTAVVLTPIESITRFAGSGETEQRYVFPGSCAEDSILLQLYKKIRAIQVGDEPDKHSWLQTPDSILDQYRS